MHGVLAWRGRFRKIDGIVQNEIAEPQVILVRDMGYVAYEIAKHCVRVCWFLAAIDDDDDDGIRFTVRLPSQSATQLPRLSVYVSSLRKEPK